MNGQRRCDIVYIKEHYLNKRNTEVKVKVTQSCPTLCDPMDYTVIGIGVGSLSFLEIHSNPGIKLGSPALQADSLPTEPPENITQS